MQPKDSRNFRQYARRVTRKSSLQQQSTGGELRRMHEARVASSDRKCRPWNAKEDARRAKQAGHANRMSNSSIREEAAIIFLIEKAERNEQVFHIPEHVQASIARFAD